MWEGIFGAETIATNTNAKHLLTVAANKNILVGRRTTRGPGAGAIPQVGENGRLISNRRRAKLFTNLPLRK
ncbi:MAG: hypothetical protein M1526_00185 [Candidatus Thermoplasmatota archaeon]|jgi:cell division protein FtsZ|nr:hypothetical protein [Candidatus Thermoplasmatota archaeon]